MVGIILPIVSPIISNQRNDPREKNTGPKDAVRIPRDALWGLGDAVIIIRGTPSGIPTPTEVSHSRVSSPGTLHTGHFHVVPMILAG